MVDGKQKLVEKIGKDLIAKTVVKNSNEGNESDFLLADNYPNPFNPTTLIEYNIPKIKSRRIIPVKLTIYDLLGQEITVLVNKYQKPGNYKVEFEAFGLSSGNYVYELRAAEFVARKQMTLVK